MMNYSEGMVRKFDKKNKIKNFRGQYPQCVFFAIIPFMTSTRRRFLTGSLAGVAGLGTYSALAAQSAGKTSVAMTGKMKLTFYSRELKLADPFAVALMTRTTTPGIQVEIEYEGLIGYGETALPPYLGDTQEDALNFLKKVNLSPFRSPLEIEDILTCVDNIAEGYTGAKAAIDIAIHDLAGKLLGVPLYKMFGLSPEKIPPTTFTIGMGKPEVMREKTRKVAQRFKILKVKLGWENDKEMIEAVRSETDLPLTVDANQGWKDKQHALDMIHWLKEKGVVFVEQPLAKDRLEESGWITERSPLPVFADESVKRLKDILTLKDYFSGINIKLMKSTGIREAYKMAALAKVCGLKVMFGCMTETSCAIAAAVHLTPLADFVDVDGNMLIANDMFQGVRLVEGRQLPSDLPGLGITKIGN
jgi:L-alanine-DL-glutamate epimerase-like enolase superfamily enzyme